MEETQQRNSLQVGEGVGGGLEDGGERAPFRDHCTCTVRKRGKTTLITQKM